MKKKAALCLIVLCALGILAAVLRPVARNSRHENMRSTMRRNENQIIAYRDSSVVEYCFSNQNGDKPVEIRIEVLLDGYYNVAKEIVAAGETATTGSTISGEPYNVFIAGIYPGRILVFDCESGKLTERIDHLEFRLYDSMDDPYEALAPSAAAEREIKLDEQEYRASGYVMRADIKQEELIANISGLFAEWRSLDSYIYASIDGVDVLIARAEGIVPRSVVVEIDLENGAAALLEAGKTYEIRVDSVYSDTQEAYDSIPGTVEVFRMD